MYCRQRVRSSDQFVLDVIFDSTVSLSFMFKMTEEMKQKFFVEKAFSISLKREWCYSKRLIAEKVMLHMNNFYL